MNMSKHFLYGLILFCIFCLSCKNNKIPIIEVIPKEAMVDEPVSVRILNCPKDNPVILHAMTMDDDSVEWMSENTFTARKGIVDLSLTAPVSGFYDSIDAMGFIWSMEPVDSTNTDLFSSSKITPIEIHLEAYCKDSLLASTTITRMRTQPGIQRIEIRENGLVGTLFVPEGSVNKPGIIYLTGSGGDMSEMRAALLASHGYISLALAYFGAEPLPKTLTNIPLEYFQKAIHFLQQQEGVDPNRIGVIGASRGGELALLLGSTYPEIKCVVGYVPSAYRCPGVEGAAWTMNGQILPFISTMGDEQLMIDIQKKLAEGKAINFTPWFNSVISDRAAIQDAEIPVEKINGPILLISGQDDQIWPSDTFSKIIVEKLRENEFKYKIKHLSYPDAGHAIGPPFKPTTILEATHPVSGILMKLGGTPAGNAYACRDSWQRLLEFLKETLVNVQ